VVNIDSNPIIGEWKPLEDSAGCNDLITFTKDKTFELIVGNKILIEGTYKKQKKTNTF
jgi:hypothetical protein